MNLRIRRVTTAAAALAMAAGALTPSPAGANLQEAPGAPVTGIPQPCAAQHPFPEKATRAEVKRQLAANTGITLTGGAWTEAKHAPLVRIVWETLDGLSCTDYLKTITSNNKGFTLNAAPTRSWAWGDWGLTRRGAVTLDFAKWQEAYRAGDRGRLVRILVHELGHAWSQTPQAAATYQRFAVMYRSTGNFGPYAYNQNENFSETIGYYVARCAAGNPYQDKKFAGYYGLVKQGVFGGREFGPAPGSRLDCSLVKPSTTGVQRVLKESLDR
ncbi:MULTISPECIES: hypothetical protein [unclassified Luteococcus]|uniref:hypothetical protein n=1 Tax=unclassified Luteococcus TaxID=2639923 RepID=UPI00313B2B9A